MMPVTSAAPRQGNNLSQLGAAIDSCLCVQITLSMDDCWRQHSAYLYDRCTMSYCHCFGMDIKQLLVWGRVFLPCWLSEQHSQLFVAEQYGGKSICLLEHVMHWLPCESWQVQPLHWAALVMRSQRQYWNKLQLSCCDEQLVCTILKQYLRLYIVCVLYVYVWRVRYVVWGVWLYVGVGVLLCVLWGACSKCTAGRRGRMNPCRSSSPRWPVSEHKTSALLAISSGALLRHHRWYCSLFWGSQNRIVHI